MDVNNVVVSLCHGGQPLGELLLLLLAPIMSGTVVSKLDLGKK